MIVVVAGDWRVHAVRGVLALLFGIAALVWPDLTVWALVLLFGAFVLVDGIMTLLAVLTGAAGAREQRGWLIFNGVAGVAIGVVTFVWPDVTALALLFLIAIWAAITGVMAIVAAIRLRRQMRNEWVLALLGVLSLAFAAVLVITPGAGALVITWLIGWFAVLYGVLLLMLAWRVRSIERSGDQPGALPGQPVPGVGPPGAPA